MTGTANTSDALFMGKDGVVRSIYNRLLENLHTFGPFQEEPKKTSIHLVHTAGFAGVHPRKSYLYLNLRTDHPIDNPRITKVEQVSRNRYHNELKLTSPDEVDAELLGWLEDAYALG
ncbi:MAG TPA: DUF5655 domain-containing protein [Ktedonobacteraceae bacterium]|nr:DUF5655 domain-containing protein [Ktedonobacteraceae bacterium]